RIRIAVRYGVSVDDPEQAAALRDDEIGVTIKGNEWSDFLNPLLNLAVVKDAAFPGNIVGDGNPQGCVAARTEQLPPQRNHTNTSLARISRVDVLVARRIIEFLGLGLY